MARHSVTTEDLTALKRAVGDFEIFLSRFEREASSHGTALLSAWSGQASREFIGEIGVWAVEARVLRDRAGGLEQRAEAARQGYEAAVERAKELAG